MHRIIALTTIALALTANVGYAQNEAAACPADCQRVATAALEWVAQLHRVPVTDVVVDTTRSGYEYSSKPWDQRVRTIGAPMFRILRGRLGFSLGSPETAWQCLIECRLDAAVMVRFHAPVFEDDGTATVQLTAITESPGHHGGDARANVYKLIFQRGDSWSLTRYYVIGRS